MKISGSYARRLPVFVALIFGCLISGQSTVWSAQKCVETSNPSFHILVPTVEKAREYQAGKPFKFTFLTYNMKNVFTDADDRAAQAGRPGKTEKNKPESEMRSLRMLLEMADADFIAAQEIESQISGSQVTENWPHLAGKYHFFLTPGNDARGINVGIFVRKSLPFKYIYRSHKDFKWTDRWQEHGQSHEETQPLFSRDFPVLEVYSQNAKEGDKPILVVGIVHNKSKRHRKNGDEKIIDFEGSRQRAAQIEGMRKILLDYKSRFGNDLPMMIAGDFNTEVQHSKEMDPIRGMLPSVFAQEQGPKDDPATLGTHAYFPRKGTPEFDQLDDIRSMGVNVLSADVLPYMDSSGHEIERPQSFEDRERMGSDHKAVRAVLEI